jgi:hypothetical protein
MADVTFMQNKYTIEELIDHYLAEIKNLSTIVKMPADESKLQNYYQAVSRFKGISVKEWVQFIRSFGRATTSKAAQMKSAFPVVLGNRVQEPSHIDVAYAELLLAYAEAFKEKRVNLKDWMLRFILSSRYSPLTGYIDREIDSLIESTERNIASYNAYLSK